ncbi:MAG TPA: hypothetical protein VD813_15075 [Pseudonocardia sp.]|nr:hypothetical protein [Pseudonocardia sp.]
MSLNCTTLHGALLRTDAVSALGEQRVRTAIRIGEWLRPWSGVLVDPRRADEALTLVAAAVLHVGAHAVVSGPTAARLHGITAVEALPVHLTVPYGHPRRGEPGLTLHNARFLDHDRAVAFGLPVLSLERTVADLLCTSRPPEALAVVDQALALAPAEQRENLRARIRERLADRPDRRGTRLGAVLLDLASDRAESPPESWLRYWVLDQGFPIPEVNWSIVEGGREVFRLDLAWPALRIALEYDGRASHSGREAADEARDEDLRARGWIVIHVRADDLRDMVRIERKLAEALSARGYPVRDRARRALRPRRHRDRPGL